MLEPVQRRTVRLVDVPKQMQGQGRVMANLPFIEGVNQNNLLQVLCRKAVYVAEPETT